MAIVQKRFWRKEREKARVLKEEVILVGDHPHSLLLSDQTSWVKKIKRDLRKEPNPRKLYLMFGLEKP